jgi:DNA-binding MarR family transcriptional regulator
MKKPFTNIEQPLGRLLSHLGKGFLNLLIDKLSYLDINRNFYALILIESREGQLTQNDLAELLDTDKVTVVRVIDYLSKKGYVIRVRNISDRRKHFLSLSSKAKKELPAIKSALEDVTNTSLRNLTLSQIDQFYSILGIIKKNLKEHKIGI